MGKDNYNLKDDNDDPYSDLLNEQSNDTLKAPEQETRAQRKWRKISKLSQELWFNARNGAMVGCMVGGSFGFIVGAYSAITSRQFMIWPLSTIISGLSFGFILGCGSMIRSDTNEQYDKKFMHIQYKTDGEKLFIAENPFWYQKYAIDQTIPYNKQE